MGKLSSEGDRCCHINKYKGDKFSLKERNRDSQRCKTEKMSLVVEVRGCFFKEVISRLRAE